MGSAVARDMLGYRVAITACDPALAAYLDRLYEAFPPADRAEHQCSVEPTDGGRFTLVVDGERIGDGATPEDLVQGLVQQLNRRVAEAAPHVMVHAGGVERGGVGVILPGPMESGKTTLTTALVREGFSYLTDEAVAFDRATGEIVPYPKPMSLDPGSWALFPELEPHAPLPTDGYKHRQWQVPPAAVRADAVGSRCRANVVVFPEHTAGATTEPAPMPRAEGLVELARNTFRFDEQGRPTLALLADVIRGAEVYRLPNGDLDEAVACVSRLVDLADG